MSAERLTRRLARYGDEPAVIAPAGRCSFAELIDKSREWREELRRLELGPGAVVALEGEFSPSTLALLLALADVAAISVPYSSASRAGRDHKDALAQVEARIRVDGNDDVTIDRVERVASHALYDELARRGHSGLVLFSSGTSGEPKAAVHDLPLLLEKFEQERPALSTVAFLAFDHMGGINTALHALSNGASVVATGGDRSPQTICRAIEQHEVELLPATPTFFNLLLLSRAHHEHDLGSLRVVSYGGEPMPQATLERLAAAFPTVRLQQTYGLVEIGVTRSRSRDRASLWVEVGGDGYETRVVDGILQVKSRSVILGYLNAPAPMTPDGWFVTGDAVAQEGDYVRFLGRASELINVGGEKVYPAEIESTILLMDDVEEVTVHGEPHPFVGQIVCATVKPARLADERRLATEIKRFCRDRLERFKVPVKVRVADEHQFGSRYKKQRRSDGR